MHDSWSFYGQYMSFSLSSWDKLLTVSEERSPVRPLYWIIRIIRKVNIFPWTRHTVHNWALKLFCSQNHVWLLSHRLPSHVHVWKPKDKHRRIVRHANGNQNQQKSILLCPCVQQVQALTPQDLPIYYLPPLFVLLLFLILFKIWGFHYLQLVCHSFLSAVSVLSAVCALLSTISER